jgi:hypothetical protein
VEPVKRSELKVGEAYYYDRSNSWTKYGEGLKAVVVDDKRYALSKDNFSWERETYEEDPKGNLVLVDVHYRYTTRRELVLTAHLRGPWEQTLAEVKAAAEDALAQRLDNARLRAAIVERANASGIKITGSSNDAIELPIADFLRLLDAYESAGRNR